VRNKKKIEEERRKKPPDKNIMTAYATQGGHKNGTISGTCVLQVRCPSCAIPKH